MALIDFKYSKYGNGIITINADKILSISVNSTEDTVISTIDPDLRIFTEECRESAVARWNNALMGKREELK